MTSRGWNANHTGRRDTHRRVNIIKLTKSGRSRLARWLHPALGRDTDAPAPMACFHTFGARTRFQLATLPSPEAVRRGVGLTR